MLLQYSIVGFEWIIGLGLAFGLAFFLNYLTYNDLPTFFIFLTIFDAFMVWVDFLPLWTLVICLIILTVIAYTSVKGKEVD
ncbi:hypothetical protein 15570_00022 [Lokiarchaeota virus WyrdV1]|nr:hypothetical protein 15570_00022 [Lokiarchaeota virus WyrdV1]